MYVRNLIAEIIEELNAAKELEKYNHLGAVAAITEELYFARHAE